MNKHFREKILFTAILFCGFFGLAQSSLAWTANADFESGTIDHIADGVSGFHWSAAHTIYSNLLSYQGSQSAEHYWRLGDQDNITGGSMLFTPSLSKGGEAWYRVYFYFQSPWLWTTNSYIKMLRITMQIHPHGRSSCLTALV